MNNIVKKFKQKRKTANARKWKHENGGIIRKMQTAAGGPVFLVDHEKNKQENARHLTIAKNLVQYPTITNLAKAAYHAYRGSQLGLPFSGKPEYYNQKETGTAPAVGLGSASTVANVVAKEYLLSSGSKAIKSTDYLMKAIKGTFPKVNMSSILKKYGNEILNNGVLSEFKNTGRFKNLMNEIQLEIEKVYGRTGSDAFDIIKTNPEGLSYRLGQEWMQKYESFFKKGGKAFVNGVSVLDSNPDAYKYVKKKIKMAADGTSTQNWLQKNSGTIQSIGSTALNGIFSYLSAKQQEKDIKKQNEAKLKDVDAQLKQQKAYYKPLAYQYALQQAQKDTNGTDENISPIVVDQQAEKLANMLINTNLKNQVKAENANAEAEAKNATMSALMGTVGNIAQSGLGILANNIGNKTQNNVKTTSGVNTTSNTLDYTQYFGNKKPYYQTNFLAK